MDEPNWLDYATAIGAVATPILVAGLGVVGWRLRARLERQAELEDQLRSDRVEIYNQILEPFIILLTSDVAWQADPKSRERDKNEVAQELLLAVTYRKKAFQMSLVGSDSVVKAYNDLMQFFYERSDGTQPTQPADLKKMMNLLGVSCLLSARAWVTNPPCSKAGTCWSGS